MGVSLALAIVWLMTVLAWLRHNDPLDAAAPLSAAAALLAWLVLRPRGVAKAQALLRRFLPR